MRISVVVLLVAALLAAGYALYQNEAIHALFESSPRTAADDPLDFLKDDRPILKPKPPRQESGPVPQPAKAERRPPVNPQVRTQVAAEPTAPAPPEAPAVPNAQVSRVVIGILKAEGLAGGLSLGVTDQRIEVAGEVDSEEKRRRIIEIFDKARGNRTLDATHLVVVPPEQ